MKIRCADRKKPPTDTAVCPKGEGTGSGSGPTPRMIAATIDDLEPAALELAAQLQLLPGLDARIEEESSQIGGGSVPAQQLPTRVVAVRHENLSPDVLSGRLRANRPCRVSTANLVMLLYYQIQKA